MKNSLLIALREWKERVSSPSFLLFAVGGPVLMLVLIYLLFSYGGQTKQHWRVLVADPTGLLENKMLINPDDALQFDFADDYIELDEFRDARRYQPYDALLEVNEKALSNKTGFVFYRNQPSVRMQTRVQFYYERRLEELMVKQFTDLSLSDFRKIKQPMNISFKDVNDPNEEAADIAAWAGMTYGAVIFVFIFLFGMTILRSVNREKSNRIVEILLSSVKAKHLLSGKIIGIGLAAFVQFICWIALIGLGLYFMRETLFPDLLDASNLHLQVAEGMDKSFQEQYFTVKEYNEYVELIYERIHFLNMTGFFLLFFLGAYLFYGSLFAAIGASMGSESDGQQFVIPLILLLCFALFSGYYVMNYPASSLASIYHYLPFTSPVVVLVKLMQGYGPGEAYQLWLSFLILIVSGVLMLLLAGRIYQNGILQFGHRLQFKHLLKWIRKT